MKKLVFLALVAASAAFGQTSNTLDTALSAPISVTVTAAEVQVNSIFISAKPLKATGEKAAIAWSWVDTNGVPVRTGTMFMTDAQLTAALASKGLDLAKLKSKIAELAADIATRP